MNDRIKRAALCIAGLFSLLSAVPTVAAEGGPADPQQEGWPWYRGPFSNGSAIDGSRPLVDSLAKATLVWKSEDWIPRTNGSKRHGGRIDGSGAFDVKGACSSPVMQDGKIFLYYFRAAESPVAMCKHFKGKTAVDMVKRGGQKKLDKKLAELGLSEEDFLRMGGNIYADDVLHCFDAATGKTLWRTAVPGGINYQHSSYGPHLTPTVNQGRVFAIGSTGAVICCDADSGELLWVNRESSYAAGFEQRLARCVERGSCPGVNRRRYEHVVAVDGVVVHKVQGGALMGIDAATGETLWTGDGSWLLMPWKYEDTWYLLAGPRLIDLKTGEKLWSVDVDCGEADSYVAVENDILVCGLTGFRISPAGAQQLWSHADTRKPLGIVSPVIHDGHWYGYAADRSLNVKKKKRYPAACIDITSGEITGTVDGDEPGAGSMWTVMQGLIVQIQGDAYGKWAAYHADPDDFRRAGERFRLPGDCAHTPVLYRGALFFKGGNYLWCYDLRQ